MDTSAIIAISKLPAPYATFLQLVSAMAVVVPTPCLYELAFGQTGECDPVQEALRGVLNQNRRCVAGRDFGVLRDRGLAPPGYYMLNPGPDEWESARNRLLVRLKLTSTSSGKGKQAHWLDSLIHSCARNTFLPLCTRDTKDFAWLNAAASTSHFDGPIPTVTPAELIASLKQDVSIFARFPQNFQSA